ncbi:MAG TPA: dienelactone hydrolase family protein, partial [Polyangia bacterium]
DDRQKARTDRYAELGYVAFTLDYYGDGRPLADRSAIGERLQRFSNDPPFARRVGTAGLDVLLRQPRTDASRIAAVGYCFGGSMVLELARTGADIKAVVGFHPGLQDRRDDSANIRGAVLMCAGADDPIVPLDHRRAFEEEMRAAGVDWRMNLYGGAKHSFTNPQVDALGSDALAYDRRTDERSWRAMLDLFDEALTRREADAPPPLADVEWDEP